MSEGEVGISGFAEAVEAAAKMPSAAASSGYEQPRPVP